LHFVELSFADQRSHGRFRVEWIAIRDLIGGFPRQSNGGIALRAMNQHAGRGLAGLTRIGEAAQDPGRNGLFQIGIWQHDVGGLSAKLLHHALDGRCRSLGDQYSGAG